MLRVQEVGGCKFSVAIWGSDLPSLLGSLASGRRGLDEVVMQDCGCQTAALLGRACSCRRNLDVILEALPPYHNES